ncbi:hypothetical protein VP1G_07157 [Cytospora mali]|uniref:Uncharacterized protein n=1 Tax=Cytospora mali TaxID=578113 RepID=A0A194V7S7_CYTMA|nr:hypothetical protein VP1G_07157 [Valsa mali var. pyri (nom. inval.)]
MPAYYAHENYAQAQPAAGSPDYYHYYSGGAPGPPTSRLQFQQQSSFYPTPDEHASNPYPHGRQVSPYRGRPQSLPPSARRRRTCRELRDSSPLDKARHLIDNAFTNSNTGLGVGVLGAIVGGLAAREAREATAHRSQSHGRHGNDKGPLVYTIIGAAVGGLAANALEKRIEIARVKIAAKEDAWERKWGRDARGRRISRDDDDEEEEEEEEEEEDEDDDDDRDRLLSRRRSSGALYYDDANGVVVNARSGR